MDKWIELGREMSLEGKELMDFVKERENAAREERVQLLELKRNEIRILELKKDLGVSSKEEGRQDTPTCTFASSCTPKLPLFKEDVDDLDCYLNRFERYAQQQAWPKETWAVNLSALLTGKALEEYARLNVKDSQSYEKVCEALCKRFHLTEDGFRKKLRNARPEKDENPEQFLGRLENIFVRWTSLAKVGKSFDQLKTLIIQEQYLSKCSPDLLIFLKERGGTDLTDLAQLTERYVEARRSSFANFYHPERRPTSVSQDQPAISQPARPTQPTQLNQPTLPIRSSTGGPQTSRPRTPRSCYVCKKPGHFANECPYRPPFVRASCLQEADDDLGGVLKEETIKYSGEVVIGSPDNDSQDVNHAPPDQDFAALCDFPEQLAECCVKSDRVTLKCGHQLPVRSEASAS